MGSGRVHRERPADRVVVRLDHGRLQGQQLRHLPVGGASEEVLLRIHRHRLEVGVAEVVRGIGADRRELTLRGLLEERDDLQRLVGREVRHQLDRLIRGECGRRRLQHTGLCTRVRLRRRRGRRHGHRRCDQGERQNDSRKATHSNAPTNLRGTPVALRIGLRLQAVRRFRNSGQRGESPQFSCPSIQVKRSSYQLVRYAISWS
jgi:hypothetical protein